MKLLQRPQGTNKVPKCLCEARLKRHSVRPDSELSASESKSGRSCRWQFKATSIRSSDGSAASRPGCRSVECGGDVKRAPSGVAPEGPVRRPDLDIPTTRSYNHASHRNKRLHVAPPRSQYSLSQIAYWSVSQFSSMVRVK